MTKTTSSFRRDVCLTLVTLAIALPCFAAEPPPRAEADEILGIERATNGNASPVKTAPAPARGPHGSQDLLLIPDSTADRVMAFDPTTGDLVNANLIPADTVNLSTPKAAIGNAAGTEVLVADQIDDVVQRYSGSGHLGVLAPAGGANTTILDNITGLTFHPNGNLLVAVQGGGNANAIAAFDAAGNHAGNFIAAGAGGLAGPFDILVRAADVLVSSINTDQILRYDLTTGAFLGVFASINNFPQQLYEAANGNVLVANFGGTQEGIVELTSAGALVAVYDPIPAGGYRGVYELPNLNLLITNGSGVFEISRANTLVSTKLSGGISPQYIERASSVFPVELLDFTIE